MIRAFVLAAALATAPTLVLAQEAVAPAAPTAEAPGEAEFEAKAEAFGGRMQQMGQEMQAAITAAAGDAAKQDADLDALEAQYQPDVDAFVVALEAFVAQQAGQVPEDQRAEMNAGIAAALPQIRAYPHQIRAQVEAAAAAQAATPPAP